MIHVETGVRNRELAIKGIDPDLDRASIRELDRIANDLEQHLCQAPLNPHDRLGSCAEGPFNFDGFGARQRSG